MNIEVIQNEDLILSEGWQKGKLGGRGQRGGTMQSIKIINSPLHKRKSIGSYLKLKKKKDIAVRSTSIEIQKKYKK